MITKARAARSAKNAGTRRFTMLAATGAAVKHECRESPIVIDFATLQMPAGKLPVMLNHSPACVVARTTKVSITGGGIIVEGKLDLSSKWARAIVERADSGRKWKASVHCGLPAEHVEFIPAGQACEVNGVVVHGPVNIARHGKLREVSFVKDGADPRAVALVERNPSKTLPRAKLSASGGGKSPPRLPGVRAGAPDPATPEPKRFSMVAYSGEPIRQEWSSRPMVIDLAGIRLPKSMPILFDHRQEAEQVVGRADSVRVSGGKLLVEGSVFPGTEGGRTVLALAGQGHEWQASIGGEPGDIEGVLSGEKVKLNGREYTGPLNVVRSLDLRECSFVIIGGAKDTVVRMGWKPPKSRPRPAARLTRAVRASQKKVSPKGKISVKNSTSIVRSKAATLSFEDWVASLGFEVASLTPVQEANLRKYYEDFRGADEPA